MYSLGDHVAVVTGAGAGVGQAIAARVLVWPDGEPWRLIPSDSMV